MFILAVLRTELSNTTTLLSHTQGFVGLIISAIGVSKFLDSSWIFDLCGMLFVVLAFVVLGRGLILFRNTKQMIESEKDKASVVFEN